MATENLMKKIGEIWEHDPDDRRKNCKTLSELYEGQIRKHVEERIKNEIVDPKERAEIALRILEIDLVKRIVDKISKAYIDKPTRILVDGNENDQNMFDWYMQNINFDETGQITDKNFNNYKESLTKCFYHIEKNKPSIISYEPYSYIIVSDDEQVASNGNIAVFDYGKSQDKEDMLLCISDYDVWVQNKRGDRLLNEMNNIDNLDGINVYGKAPWFYIKKTNISTMPYPDESMISVATLIPMLCGDINYAIKYMSYAIVYGVNVKEEMIKRGPNAFFNLIPFDETSPNKPEVGVLKPDIDIKEVFDGIMMQLQLWLNSRGISASILGYNTGAISSGVSKMIDEADVTNMISHNQEIYSNYEKDMFDFIMHNAHDIWKNNNLSIPQSSFSPNCYVKTTFNKPQIIKTRDDIIKEVKEELGIGLTSKRRAIKRLNPNMSDDEIKLLIEEIAEEKEQKDEMIEDKEED